MELNTNDLALLILRLAIAYVFLHGAWMISRNETVRDRSVKRTAILFASSPYRDNMTIANISAYVGFALMYLGSIGLILGLATRISAALLLIFTVPGIVVHLRERDQAIALVESVSKYIDKADQSQTELLKWSAYAGHQSSANKNYALLGAALFFILASDPHGSFALDALY